MSDRFRFRTIVYGEYKLKEELSKYPIGSEVTVFYDPVKPAVSVLLPGVEGLFSVLIWMSLGAIISLVVVLKILFSDLFRISRERSSPELEEFDPPSLSFCPSLSLS